MSDVRVEPAGKLPDDTELHRVRWRGMSLHLGLLPSCLAYAELFRRKLSEATSDVPARGGPPHVDVELDESGDVLALWYGSELLPFVVARATGSRPAELRAAYERSRRAIAAVQMRSA